MASTIGTSHIAASQPCQDSHGCKILRDSSGQPVVVLVASDGAGSASVADIGSALACETFVKLVADYLDKGGQVKDITRPLVERWIAGIVYGFETFALSPSLSVSYGGRFARYDYLTQPSSIIPRLAVMFAPKDRLRVNALVSSRASAPGASASSRSPRALDRKSTRLNSSHRT